MPRYFFHVVSKREFIGDEHGVVLDGPRAAHRHAMRLVGRTLPVLGSEDLRDWRIEITDQRQSMLLTVLFPATAPLDGAARQRTPAPVSSARRAEPPSSAPPLPSGSGAAAGVRSDERC
jgi:hypothetical protein